jgi:hypothetical protein
VTDSEPEDRETGQPSGPKRYDKRIEEWVRGLQEGAEQRAPEVLDDLASTAKNVARYLEEQAEKARRKRGPQQAVEKPQEAEESAPE